MTAFHEVRFPVNVSYGSSGGPERRTQVAEAASGYEERNSSWADSRRRYNAAQGLRHIDQIHDTIAFFEERRGRLTGFRWKDWADFKSCRPSETPAATDQLIGTGTGALTVFQLQKTYGASFSPWSRPIKKPVAGTVLIALNGAAQLSGWSVNNATGVVTFLAAPGNGVAVRAGFEFDVPVRFDTDRLDIDLAAFRNGSIPSIPIVELRL